MKRVLVVIGTRPEAIKLFPVVHALKRAAASDVRVCTSGQHADIVAELLAFVDVESDHSLPQIAPGQPLNTVMSQLIARLDEVLAEVMPDWVIVQGDTVTTIAATLAAHARGVSVAHVEAGLRTGDLSAPWPEEGYRRAVTAMATLHFAPTEGAAAALCGEGVPAATVHVTGNTVVDALHWVRGRVGGIPELAGEARTLLARLAGKAIVLVTAHRRESLGEGMRQIAEALDKLAERDDIALVVARHPNPAARAAFDRLAGRANIALLDRPPYPDFIHLLERATIVLTDSGGVQEEAPVLGTPVVVLRDVTERPEGVEAGAALLVGTSPDRVIAAVTELLDDPEARARMALPRQPFGDGHAAERIAAILAATSG